MKLGDTFGDYTVVRQLGKGGMGEVWLLEGKSGRQVAAKILEATADHESRKRFLREAQLALGVKHPNLVETYDVGEDPESGLCYILMEYVPGGTLADYIKANGALAIEDAVAVVEAIAGVLELGRQKGIVHRDIKPANIMFDAEGTPKLADLGIARAGAAGTETTTVTQTGAMIGTPAYMSPEQMLDSHNVDTRADIYSLGVVFFEMLTGQRPNKDDTIVQLMAKAVKGEPLPDVRTLRPEVSASLAQLLNMMVAPDKDGRISTPGQITNALAIIERGGELVDATSSSRHVGEASLPRQSKDGSVQFRRGEDAASTGARQDASPTGRGHDSASTGARQDASPTGRAVAPRLPDSSPAGRATSMKSPPKWLIPVLVLAALAGAFFCLAPKKNNLPSTSSVQTVVKEVARTNIVDRYVVRTNVVERNVIKTNRVEKIDPVDRKVVKSAEETAAEDVRRALPTLFPGWQLDTNLLHPGSGLSASHRGRNRVLMVHPPNVKTPAVLSRRMKLPGKFPCLVLEMSSGAEDSDFLVSVRVDGLEALSQRLVCTPNFSPWERILVPLNRWRGHEVKIEIILKANNWYHEHPYFSRIDVVEGTGKEVRGAVGIVAHEIFPRADFTDAKWKSRAPWLYTTTPPPVNWKDVGFDDSTWSRTVKPLGYGKSKQADAIAEPGGWTTGQLWMRRKFSYHGDKRLYKVALDAFYDENAEVYLNGTLILPLGGWSRTWIPVIARASLVAELLREGENVLSVKVQGDGYASYFDCGLTFEFREKEREDKIVSNESRLDPAALADPDATRATQKALDALFPGWKVSEVLPDNKDTASWAFGYQKNWRGRNDVVTTMPVNGEKPCVLSRKVKVTGKHPVLLMEVASQNWDTDFLLSVRVNRKTVLDRRLICTPDDTPYERIQVPLSEWKGREVMIEVEHFCNGWYYEHAFWGRLEIVEGTGKETCGPVGIASTEAFPHANLKNKKWMKRTPWAYTVREPSANWKDADFDDSRWMHTKKALGFDKGPVMTVADEWHADRIWIRRKFNWSSAQPFYKAVFDLCYDQDIEIFLNGVCISKMGGWNGSWTPYAAWSMRVAEALRKGENILAITLKGDGASYFDCGLTIETRSAAPSMHGFD